MQFSFVAVYLTLLLTLGLAGARPVLNLEQRDECGLACVESNLLSREAEASALSARAPSSLDATAPTDLVARFLGFALKAAKIGVNIGKKIFGGIKKKHHKKTSAAKGAAKGGQQGHNQRQNRKHKRDLELLWEEFAEREFEDAADLYERSFEFDGDDEVFVRGYDEVFLDDLE